MADGSVEFEIKANNSDVSAKISDTTGKLKAAAGQWESATQGAANSSSMFGGVLQGVGQMLGGVVLGAAKSAAGAIKQFAVSCIEAASDLDEVKNVVDTVFGDGAKEIYSWAQQAQTAFGLTQTAALKYASTLGAMMKSSGLGLTEVKEMSTTLAGLAADMASFYNLDFDTAFEKLKSGISGETEPLKALGIDLSAASLEAFRLAQGIDKAYSSMSQAEQIALRYQYIMSATADAQGDFARTSDGYANSMRRIESAWASIKTSLGGVILPVVEQVTGAVAGLLEMLTKPPEKTLFDEIADINTDYTKKIEDIKTTAAEARVLIGVLNDIHNNTAVTDQSTQLGNLLESLGRQVPALWEAIKDKDPSTKIYALAKALSNDGQGIDFEAWREAISKYAQFSGALEAAMQSNDPTSKIHDLAEELSKGSNIDAGTWEKILNTFAKTLSKSNVTVAAGEVESKISSLAEKMSMRTGIPVAAWNTAFTNFNGFKDQFFSALSSNDPGAKLDELADKLAAKYPTLDFGTWKGILAQLASDLKAEDANLDVTSIIGKLSGLADAAAAAGEVKLGNLLSTIEQDAGTTAHTNVDAWTAVLGTFAGNVTGVQQALSTYNGGSSQKIKDLATALSGIDGDEAKVTAWKELVGLLTSNAEEIQAIMGWTGEDTWGWITSLLTEVNKLDSGKAGDFEKLWNLLLGGGEKKGAGEMSVPSSVIGSVQELGGAMESTYYASAEELEILKRLMQLYPQMSAIVNTHTGEVKGGIQALQDYVDEAEAMQIKLAMMERLAARKEAIGEHQKTVWRMEAELSVDAAKLEMAQEKADKFHDTLMTIARDLNSQGVFGQAPLTEDFLQQNVGSQWFWTQIDFPRDFDFESYRELMQGKDFEGVDSIMSLVGAYNNQLVVVGELAGATDEMRSKLAEETEALDFEKAALEEETEAVERSTGSKIDNKNATDQVIMSEENATKALATLKGMIQDIVNYQENARKSALSTISQTVDGLKALDRTTKEYKASISGNQLYSNLNDQLAFLEEYSRLLDQARARGFTDEVIASVADGSVESLQYLRGLATATAGEVESINARFAEVTSKKNDLADKVAAQRLAVDKEYQAMIDKAVEAALAMDQSATAGAGATATMEAVVSAVAAGHSSLQTEVDAIIALMAQIGSVGNYTIGGASGGIIGTGGPLVGKAKGAGGYAQPFAMGLDSVPYDGFLAELHQGEAILTADEAAIWRNFTGASEAAGQQSFDYDMIGSMISGIPSGGNVYLDGQTVGKLISQGQGESYRRLQRSGWRG